MLHGSFGFVRTKTVAHGRVYWNDDSGVTQRHHTSGCGNKMSQGIAGWAKGLLDFNRDDFSLRLVEKLDRLTEYVYNVYEYAPLEEQTAGGSEK